MVAQRSMEGDWCKVYDAGVQLSKFASDNKARLDNDITPKVIDVIRECESRVCFTHRLQRICSRHTTGRHEPVLRPEEVRWYAPADSGRRPCQGQVPPDARAHRPRNCRTRGDAH